MALHGLSRRNAAITVVSLLVASCGGRYGAGEPPTIQARVAQFAGADGNSIGVRFELTAFNPNPFELFAREMDATLAIAGQTVANARVTFTQVLPPERPFPMSANLALPRTAMAAFANAPMLMAPGAPPSVPFTISGNLMVQGRGGTTFVVPVSVQGVVAREMFLGLLAPAAPPPMMVPGMVGGNANTY